MGRTGTKPNKGKQETEKTNTRNISPRAAEVLPGRGGGHPGGQYRTGTREASRAGQETQAARADPGTQEAIADRGSQAAMADRGSQAAMADQGSPAAMAGQGSPWPWPLARPHRQ